MRMGVEHEKGLGDFHGFGAGFLGMAAHATFAVTADPMGIDGQDLGPEMVRGAAQFAERHLEPLGLVDRMGIQQQVDGAIGG